MHRALIAPVLLSIACASSTRLPATARASIDARHRGRTVELRQSCFYGDLYDENEKLLLSPHPFAEVSHIVDLDGAPIHPTGQRGIVPAGTPMVISRIEFPDVAAMSARMLTTPRYNPWVYLSLADNADPKLPRDRTYILLLPMDFETEEAIETEIARFFARTGEVTAWLAERRPTVRVAIEHKEVREGMSADELVAALGTPRKWLSDDRDGRGARVAWYPSQELWVVADRVVAIEEARPLTNRPAGLYDTRPPPKANAQPPAAAEADPAPAPEPASAPAPASPSAGEPNPATDS